MMYEGMNDEVMSMITDFRDNQIHSQLPTPLTDEHILGIIRNFSAFNYALTKTEHAYNTLKHEYEVGLIECKYSVDYQCYKTVKEKEEHAKEEMADKKQKLIDMKYQIDLLKANIEEIEKLMRLSFMIYGREVDD